MKNTSTKSFDGRRDHPDARSKASVVAKAMGTVLGICVGGGVLEVTGSPATYCRQRPKPLLPLPCA